MRQVVDANRQLSAIDAQVVDATSLLKRAGACYPLGLLQRSPLSRQEVLFFKANVATLAGLAVAS